MTGGKTNQHFQLFEQIMKDNIFTENSYQWVIYFFKKEYWYLFLKKQLHFGI